MLRRLIEVGIAGNLIRWVGSFPSNRWVMLVINGRTGRMYDIRAGLPQGSSASPVLFILSVSAISPGLGVRHPNVQAI